MGDESRSFSANSTHGFTLVELVVTLVIIGALATVGAPLFFSAQSFEQSGFFNETVSAVRYAQKLAIASGCTVRVNVSGTGYSLLRAANQATCNTAPFATAITDPSDPGRTFSRSAPSGTTVTAADFTYDPLGRAVSVATPSQTITVSGPSGSRQFRIWAETGLVEVL